MKVVESYFTGRKHCGKKEKLLVTRNFSFALSVFLRLTLQTCKNQSLFMKGLTSMFCTLFQNVSAFEPNFKMFADVLNVKDSKIGCAGKGESK